MSFPSSWRRYRFSLQQRITLLLILLVLIQSIVFSAFTMDFISDNLEEQMGVRAMHIAQTVAGMPAVQKGIEQKSSHQVQGLVDGLRKDLGIAFIVVGDKDGIRFAHPVPERLGQPMVGGDNTPALVEGKTYVSKAVGTLGPSLRGKTPIIDNESGDIIGIVSVGYMLDQIDSRVSQYQKRVIFVSVLILMLSIFFAIKLTRYIKGEILGLEPEEIAQLLEEKSATLESVREGIIAINAEGRVMSMNKAALTTLNLSSEASVENRSIQDIFPNTSMQQVLETGAPEYDQEIVYNGRIIIANRIPIVINGAIAGVVSSFRAKDEIDQLINELQQIHRLADMLLTQAHEYSNKLSTIAGLIQVGAPEQAVELINQETTSHQHLIQLFISAVPDPILAGCLLGKYNRARELGLHLEIDRESSMLDVPEHLPRDLLVSLLGNILDNAFEATLSKPGAIPEVRLSMTDIGNDLIFEIEDEGAGIPSELRDRILQKGVTNKNGSGHGLGLYLVRTILDQLNGDILFENGSNGGARVTLIIPKQKPS